LSESGLKDKRDFNFLIIYKNEILTTANKLLSLTYVYSAKELPAIMDNYLSQLVGGEDWG